MEDLKQIKEQLYKLANNVEVAVYVNLYYRYRKAYNKSRKFLRTYNYCMPRKTFNEYYRLCKLAEPIVKQQNKIYKELLKAYFATVYETSMDSLLHKELDEITDYGENKVTLMEFKNRVRERLPLLYAILRLNCYHKHNVNLSHSMYNYWKKSGKCVKKYTYY